MDETKQRNAPWRLVAWGIAAVMIALTLGPDHVLPDVPEAYGIDHLAAFALVGILFGFADPTHLRRTAAFGLVALVLLELAQIPLPDRHALAVDVVTNVLGLWGGLAAAALANRALRASRRPREA